MRARGTSIVAVCALCFATAHDARAGQHAGTPAPAGLVRPEPAAAAGAATVAVRRTVIIGFVWAPDNTPVPDARVQLRYVPTGRIDGRTITDADGRFSFSNIEVGPYVIEVIDERGRVLAVGHPLHVEAGETIATFVRLSAPSALGGLFASGAAAVVGTAAGLGVTAIAPTGVPESRDR